MLIDFAWIYIVLSTSLKTRVSNSGHIFLWKNAIDKDLNLIPIVCYSVQNVIKGRSVDVLHSKYLDTVIDTKCLMF